MLGVESLFSRLSALWPRLAIPTTLVAITSVGLSLHEVWPRYTPGRPDFLVGDCPYYRTTLVSLIEDHDLDVRNNLSGYPPSGNVALGKNGAWYPKHAILMPIVAIPFFLVAGNSGLLIFNVAQIVGLLLIMWVGARRFVSGEIALLVVLWYAFGTVIRPAAYNFSPDMFSTLLVTAGLVALLYKRVGLAGLLLGLAVWSKWTNVVFLPVAALYVVHCRRHRLFWFAAGALPPLLGLLALNFHMFGSPFLTPYDCALIEENGQMVHWASHRTFFNLPFWWGLKTQLTDQSQGLLVACPPILFAVPGAVLLARRARADALLIGGCCMAQLATFAKYDQWRASSYGPRFLLTVVSLSALLVAPALNRLLPGRAPNRW